VYGAAAADIPWPKTTKITIKYATFKNNFGCMAPNRTHAPPCFGSGLYYCLKRAEIEAEWPIDIKIRYIYLYRPTLGRAIRLMSAAIG
jgi:hypothetical protein